MVISNIFPKTGVPSSWKGGWVDLTWDKVLNSIVFAFGRHPLVGIEEK